MSYDNLTNRLYVTIYLRENDLGLLANRAAQIEKAERIAEKLGIRTTYEIEDYEGRLVFHVGTQRIKELVGALRDGGIPLGPLEVADAAALLVAETLGLEYEDLVDLMTN